MKVKGKLIRRSLKSKSLSVGKHRLADLEKQERQMAENASSLSEGKMTFADALQIYRQRLHGEASRKPRTKAHREERIAVLLKTWPSLETTDVRKITKQDCLQWGPVKDIARARRVASQVRAGRVAVNGLLADPQAPGVDSNSQGWVANSVRMVLRRFLNQMPSLSDSPTHAANP
jgi:hypothetical protein